MRRLRKNRTNKIDIDLTSVMDVIFILIFVLIIALVGKSNENIAESGGENAQLDAIKENYEQIIESKNELNKMVKIIAISVPFSDDNPKNRDILVLIEGDKEESFELEGEKTEEVFKSFEDYLNKKVQEINIDKPIILSLNENDEKILYRDEKRIIEILTDVSQKNEHVYIKGTLSEE